MILDLYKCLFLKYWKQIDCEINNWNIFKSFPKIFKPRWCYICTKPTHYLQIMSRLSERRNPTHFFKLWAGSLRAGTPLIFFYIGSGFKPQKNTLVAALSHVHITSAIRCICLTLPQKSKIKKSHLFFSLLPHFASPDPVHVGSECRVVSCRLGRMLWEL